MSRRVAITGGAVVGPEATVVGDVLIEGGLIAQVGEVDRSGADVVDATGCLVLPGAIDVHTHPFGGVRDDTRSALLGGTTSALAFVDALEGERPVEAARRTLADELPDSLIDLAFHAVIWEPLAYRPGDMRDVAELGVGSVKLWLAYVELGIMADDDVALAVMQEAAALGMVVLAHCENGRAIDAAHATARRRRAGSASTRSRAAGRSHSRPSACTASWRWPRWRARRRTSCTSRAPVPSPRSQRRAGAA